MAGLQKLGSVRERPDVLLRFLQLGNEIQGEMGHGKDDQVMQLIQALLDGTGMSMAGLRAR